MRSVWAMAEPSKEFGIFHSTLVGRAPPYDPCPGIFPDVLVLIRQKNMCDVKYSVDPSSPHAQFAVFCPGLILPSNFPCGVNTHTPPGPVANKFPALSTFIPSGRPGCSSVANFVAS